MIVIWDNGAPYSDHGIAFLSISVDPSWPALTLTLIEQLLVEVAGGSGKIIATAPELAWRGGAAAVPLGDYIEQYNYRFVDYSGADGVLEMAFDSAHAPVLGELPRDFVERVGSPTLLACYDSYHGVTDGGRRE